MADTTLFSGNCKVRVPERPSQEWHMVFSLSSMQFLAGNEPCSQDNEALQVSIFFPA